MVCHSSEERSYHIFYQLCASRHLPELQGFELGEKRKGGGGGEGTLEIISVCAHMLEAVMYNGLFTLAHSAERR